MDKFDRRRFLKGSLLTAASWTLPLGAATAAAPSGAPGAASPAGSAPVPGQIIDTNVDLPGWPYRTLKYGTPQALVQKLRWHGVRQAWAGSFDALFHKDLDGVNARLAEACHGHGGGLLVPFGTVNPVWPDWEEDLRRCREAYHMPGIKLHPGYHGYALDHPAFVELLRQATERDLLVQIAVAVEDERMQHPGVDVAPVDVTPLAGTLRQVPGARVMLVNPFRHVRREKLQTLLDETDVVFEISNLDTVGALERALHGEHTYLRYPIPLERLLFGSHLPFFTLENALMKLVESRLTQEQARAIMEGNALRMLQTT